MKVKLNRFCTCGASQTGSASPKLAEHLLKLWNETHTGPGHKPCDAKTASRMRDKQERQSIEPND